MKALSIRRFSLLLLAVMLTLAQAGCAFSTYIDTAATRQHSYAIAQGRDTTLGRVVGDAAQKHPGKSGFRLLENGDESLFVRLALIEAAEKTIDLQYYAIHDDMASNLMLEAVLRAAERGVRVRFLIDGVALSQVHDHLAILDNRENVAIRVFNPVIKPRFALWGNVRFGFIGPDSLLRRMHNKVLVADNQLAVTGGRNLGDEYFDANPDFNFKDLDTLAAGPIVARISHSFDRYWNDDKSHPIAELRSFEMDAQAQAQLRADMRANWQIHMDKTPGQMRKAAFVDKITQGDLQLVWAKAELSVDMPEKIDGDVGGAGTPMAQLEVMTENAAQEFVAVTPYFVPGDGGVAWLAGMAERGVRVRLLTNSLASTDVVATHSGYKKYREDVIRAGGELYEFKPIDGQRPRQRPFARSAPARASLHSKVYVIDRTYVIVGSYNLDPRSVELNTEIAILIHSPKLAAQVLRTFEQAIAPAQSYRVVLQDDRLRWVAEEAGEEVVYRADPKAGFGRRVQSFLIGLLPIERQL